MADPYDEGRAARRTLFATSLSDNPHRYGGNEARASAWDDGWLDEDQDIASGEPRPMATENDYHAGVQARHTGVAIEDNPHPADSAEAIVWRKGWNDKDREIMAEIDRKDRYIKAEIDRMVDALPGREPVSAQDKMLAALAQPAKPKVIQLAADHGALYALKDDGTIWMLVDGCGPWQRMAPPGDADG